MKYYLTILILTAGVWISVAQTNGMAGADTNAAAGVTTNAITNATELMPVLMPTNLFAASAQTNLVDASAKTNHPASRPRQKITIHSEGPFQMDLNQHWITYQDHV